MSLVIRFAKKKLEVLQVVLGEAKPIGDGPMAEIGGDELRF